MASLYGELRVFTGNANPALAERICEYIGIPMGRAEVFEFFQREHLRAHP